MNDTEKKFISSQTIKDKSGQDLSFINKVIFYNKEFEFLTSKNYTQNNGLISFFEYDYSLSCMEYEIVVKRPSLSATIIPAVTVPTVVISDSNYTMYTYYIAKVLDHESLNSQYSWLSSDSIMALIKQKKFCSDNIYNMRQFFELLLESKDLLK